MKGIVLAGGSGSRLYPMSVATSKQLMPVFDKPMIYYPISTLMLAGIREILVITTKEHKEDFERLLGTGEKWGISFTYLVQPEPKGIAEAFLLGESFIGGDSCALILGDNLFYGGGLGESLRARTAEHRGALIFCQEVQDPERYGVVEIGSDGEVISIQEKPAKAKSNLAATGLYFFDAQVVQKAKVLKPSSRGELEISDLNNLYLKDNQLEAEVLQRGAVWLDTGTVDSLNSAAEFVRVIQDRQGFKIGAPEEVAWRMGFISSDEFRRVSEDMPTSDYKAYLLSLLSR